jgi:hypothetical protein
MKDTNISDSNRNKLRDLIKANNLDEIRARCTAGVYGSRSKKLLEYIVPFSEVNESIYQPMKGKIAILQFDRLIMPHIINGVNNSEFNGWASAGGAITKPRMTRKRRSQPKKG